MNFPASSPAHPPASWRRLFPFLIAAGLTLCSLAPAQSLSFGDRFGSVKKWRLRYRFSANSPYKWNDGGISRDRIRWDASESGTIIITMLSLAPHGQLEGEGSGTVSAAIDRSFVESSAYYSDSRYDRGSGTTTTRARLYVDLDAGTYQLEIQNGDIPAQYGGRDARLGQPVRNWGPSDELTHTPMPSPLAPAGLQRLPATGRTLSGSWTWEEQLAAMEAKRGFDRAEWSKRQPASGKLSWTLEPDEPEEDELLLEVDNYDTWLPIAGRDEDTTGNSATIQAKVVSKKGGAPAHKAVLFRAAFADVSSEPGVALNLPLKGAKSTPDLLFESSANPGGWSVSGEGDQMQLAGTAMTSARVCVSSRDWGAHGEVTITATLDNGRILRGRLKSSDQPDVRLPRRGTLSRIGDAWKKMMGFTGSDADDLDEQEGNTNDGDGLTAYEEYRGLIVDGKHTRESRELQPTRKEVVVANELGDIGRAGFAFLERASAIHVVEFPAGTLPTSRQVNLNRKSAYGGEQYGLKLHAGAMEDGVGENVPARVTGKTPRLSQEVVIDTAKLASKFAAQKAVADAAGESMPYTLEESLSNTVAHELAHGIRAPHHGPATEYAGPFNYTAKMTSWRAIGSDGVPLLPPQSLDGMIGRPGNEASGDTNCIMCYTSYYAWAAIGPEGGPYRFYKTGLSPVGKIFCRSPDPTGFNVPHPVGKKITLPGLFGAATAQEKNAPVGNCLGAMKVRDW